MLSGGESKKVHLYQIDIKHKAKTSHRNADAFSTVFTLQQNRRKEKEDDQELKETEILLGAMKLTGS